MPPVRERDQSTTVIIASEVAIVNSMSRHRAARATTKKLPGGSAFLPIILASTILGISGCSLAPTSQTEAPKPSEEVEVPLETEAPVEQGIAYTLPDGSTVEIVEGEPLPAAVIQQLAQDSMQVAAPLRQRTPMTADQANAYYQSVADYLTQKSEETGRKIVALVQSSDIKSPTGTVWLMIASNRGNGYTGIKPNYDKDAAIASAQFWAEKRNYALIVT